MVSSKSARIGVSTGPGQHRVDAKPVLRGHQSHRHRVDGADFLGEVVRVALLWVVLEPRHPLLEGVRRQKLADHVEPRRPTKARRRRHSRHRASRLEPFEHRLRQLSHCQSVYRQHHIGGCRAGHPGHVHQPVEPALELLYGGIDTPRIRQVDFDVAGYRRSRGVAVERVDLRPGREQLLRHRVPDPGRRAGHDIAFGGELRHLFAFPHGSYSRSGR